MASTLRNTKIDALRRDNAIKRSYKKIVPLEVINVLSGSTDENPEAGVLKSEDEQRLIEAINSGKLTAREQVVVWLRYQGYSHEEIARQENTSEGASKAIYSRALAKLRKILS